MELVMSAVGMMTGSTATAATVTAASGLSAGAIELAGFGTAAAGASSIFSTVATGTTMASAALSLFGGSQQAGAVTGQAEMQARSLELQSKQDLLDSQSIDIEAKQEANDLMDRLNRALAGQRLAFAANGVDPSFGTPEASAKSAERLTDLQISETKLAAKSKALSRRRQSYERLIERGNVLSQASNQVSSIRTNSGISALSSVSDLIDRRLSRG